MTHTTRLFTTYTYKMINSDTMQMSVQESWQRCIVKKSARVLKCFYFCYSVKKKQRAGEQYKGKVKRRTSAECFKKHTTDSTGDGCFLQTDMLSSCHQLDIFTICLCTSSIYINTYTKKIVHGHQIRCFCCFYFFLFYVKKCV